MRGWLSLLMLCFLLGPGGFEFVIAASPARLKLVAAGEPAENSSEEKKEGSPEEAEEAPDKEPADEETTDEEATDEEATDKETNDEETADKEANDKEATDEEAPDEEATGEPSDHKEEETDKGEPEKKEAKKSVQKKEADHKQSSVNDSPQASAKKNKSTDQKEADEPYLVEQRPLKIEVDLTGAFVAHHMVEVTLQPKVWAIYKVLEAIPHGTQVRKGEVLVRFDSTKYEEMLAEESLDQHIEELDLMAAEEEFPRLERLAEMSFNRTQRMHDELAADYERFKSTLRPLSEKIAKFNYKSSQESLAMEQEELDQLQQMYEADDLTEETEKIVLRRQQFAVEMAQLYIEYARFNRDTTLEVSLPRYQEQMAAALEQSRITLERAKLTKSLSLSKARYELEKKRAQRARHVDQHAKLLGDQEWMELKSPVDGVVYYGRCVDGKWSSISSMRSKLKPFGSISPRTVLFTIVQQDPLEILSSVSEKYFPQMQSGLAASIRPTGDAELEWQGKVTHVNTVPVGRGKFPLRIEFDQEHAPDWLVADMTCKVKVTTYENEEALLIPATLVETDKEHKKRKYVFVLDDEEEEPVRRKVKLGRSKGKLVEVVKGLEAGEKIVKSPEDDKPEE